MPRSEGFPKRFDIMRIIQWDNRTYRVPIGQITVAHGEDYEPATLLTKEMTERKAKSTFGGHHIMVQFTLADYLCSDYLCSETSE